MRAELLIARSKVRKYNVCGLKLPIEMDELTTLANRYFEKTNSKKIIMESDDAKSFYVIDYITRFSPRYTKLMRKRFTSYFKELTPYRHSKSLFLTLTVDPKHCYSLNHARVKLSHSFSLITNWIRRAFRLHVKPPAKKPRGNPLIPSISFSSLNLKPLFIKTFEFTQSGLIHLHALLINVSYLPQQLLHAANDGRNRIEVIKHGLRAGVRYIYKYIVKNHRYVGVYDEVNPIINDHTVLAWALGLRTFSISLSNKGISHQESIANSSVPLRGDERGDKRDDTLSKPTHQILCLWIKAIYRWYYGFHKMMVIGDLPTDIVGYYPRERLSGLLSELTDRGGSNL